MFCPNCKYEYKEGIRKCPDCGSDLVQEFAEEKHPDFDTVMLTKVGNEIEGQELLIMLKEKRIECFFADYSGGYPVRISLDSGMARGYIVVNKDKFEKAKEVLEDYKKSIER